MKKMLRYTDFYDERDFVIHYFRDFILEATSENIYSIKIIKLIKCEYLFKIYIHGM